ncbi:hypothetical protein, conserved [Eimeria tenella]|uniref:Uncharacterized protein n=1 Tax=Eimeria tenella TaxID=5802 RepID=U6KZR4_EIMTE|nr:hypothetical protein, conserved [Eimeria tenella]CDJ40980.1 hypothetical protein, conserved [Eimeria tenella]|eukprot:XP_013231730.1 hypothetical protein, conserved [Eimeria tenella]
MIASPNVPFFVNKAYFPKGILGELRQMPPKVAARNRALCWFALLGVVLALSNGSVCVHSSSLPPWACDGKEGFVQQCGKCVADSQCESGLFCCPTLRVCMRTRSDRCRKPYNVCRSTYRMRRPEYADEITWARECEGPGLVEWMTCP